MAQIIQKTTHNINKSNIAINTIDKNRTYYWYNKLMVNQSNSKIVGAFVIGLALVSGSYVLSNFGKTYSNDNLTQTATSVEIPIRQAIAVSDSNGDGVEDWQEEFVKTTVIDVSTSTEDSVPKSLTGKIGVSFIEDIIRAKNYGEFGPGTDGVIKSTVDIIAESAKDEVFDVTDITIKDVIFDEEIRDYANTHAKAIIENNVKGLRDPLVILKEVLEGNTERSLKELETLRDVYLYTRDAVIKIPVPNTLAKEHLDLINVYNALYQDINGLTLVQTDPLVSLIRLKRYEEDTLALNIALRNLSEAIAKYQFTYEKDEPALIFTIFNQPLNQSGN